MYVLFGFDLGGLLLGYVFGLVFECVRLCGCS